MALFFLQLVLVALVLVVLQLVLASNHQVTFFFLFALRFLMRENVQLLVLQCTPAFSNML